MEESHQLNSVAPLFDHNSETYHAALQDLAVVLEQLGFKVRKNPPKRPHFVFTFPDSHIRC